MVRHFEKNPDPRVEIDITQERYNHAEDRKRSYIEGLLNSPFILCSRGQGAFTQRFVEVIALGRVPVMLADAWIPPRDMPLTDLAVVAPENKIGSLLGRVEQAIPRAKEMGRIGRAYWEKRYAPEVRLERLLDEAFDLLDSMGGRAPSLAEYQVRWQSLPFHHNNGWMIHQRVLRRLRRLVIKDPR